MASIRSVEQRHVHPLPPSLHREWEGPSASLPVPLTSFVGREQEIAAAIALVQTGRVRLLTLTGPGGVGKTRLALRIAALLAPRFANGAVFVPLAAISDPDLVVAAIGAAAGGRDAGARAAPQALAVALRDQELLLLLDNFEQLVAAAPQVAHLLHACPRLVVLITSRAPLHIAGEQEFPVSPLPLPGPGARVEDASVSDAVILFEHRARAVDPTFSLTPENALTVAAVCHRLDGLPLAVELAAARTRILPPAALLPRLAHRLPLLGGGPREAPARLRTMRDAIAWSYDLLSAPEQTLFRRLAIFVGGFTLEAAAAVAGDREADLVAGIETLAEQSLIRRLDGDDEPRFGMLETIREFGLEQLQAAGELDEMRQRHAAWIVCWTESIAPDPIDELRADQVPWLAGIERELPNVRSALESLLAAGNGLAVLQVLTWTGEFWTALALHRDEVRVWIEAGLDAAPSTPPRLRAGALHILICAAATLGDSQAAVRHAQEAVEIGQRLNDPFILGRAFYSLGLAYEFGGAGSLAETSYAAAAPLFRQIEAPTWLGASLGGLGDMRHWSGDVTGAAALLDEGLATYRATGQAWGISLLLGQRAHVALTQRDLTLATRFFLESLAVQREIGNEWLALGAAAGLAGVAWRRGHPERATRLLGAIARMQEQTGIARIAHSLHADRVREGVRTSLGTTDFAACWRAGTAMTYRELLAEAEAIGATGSDPRSTAAADRKGLTQRECEVLHLLTLGRSDREIADALFITRRTAQTHVANIFAKLEVGNRAEATAAAIRAGLV